MTLAPQCEPEALQIYQDDDEGDSKAEDDKILCPHCLRTATNGIKCQGICVADSDY